MNSFLSDLRYGLRTLCKSPGYTLVAVATLALSLGANTAIFSFVNAVLLKPLPYPDANRLVRVLEAPPGGGRNGISTLNFLDWQKQNSVFEFLAAQTGGSVSLTGIDEPIQIPGARVGVQYFDIYGVKPFLGRTFAAGEDESGKNKVAVISYSLWQGQFAGDPAVVGRSVLLDNEPHTIIGILPRGSPFERRYAKVWRPLTFLPANMTRNFHWFGAVGKLKAGVTLEQARAQMDTIGKRISQDYPDSNKDWGVGLDLLSEINVQGDLRRSLYVLLAAVGMVLLIACANLANLSLMRVIGREREIAVRLALGAGRWALARQFLAETLVVAGLGGVFGVLLGQLALVGLKTAMPPFSLPAEANVVLDGRVLLFSFVLTLLTGLLVGLMPALQAARANLSHSLKQGGHGGTAGAHARVRRGLVIAEVALAFVLLSGAGLLIRSLNNIGAVDPGFDPTNVLTFRLPMSDKQFPDATALNTHLREVTARLAALPGVTGVALTSSLPMNGWGYGMPFQIAGQTVVDHANRKACFFKMVSPSYFSTLRMHLVKGRLLAETDRAGSPPSAVINETMARRYLPGVDPIGQRVLIQEIVPGKTQLGAEIPWEVVGVVADEAVGGLDDDRDNNPGLYVSNAQSAEYGQAVVLRAAGDTALLREAVKKSIHAISPDQTLPDMKTLETIVAESMGENRLRVLLLGTFAGVSLLLSAIGIYGVISYSVTQRQREIGIRSALGASRGNVLRLILRDGMGLAILGLLVGVAGSFGLMHLLGSMLFGVGNRDPITLFTVAGILGAVAFIACFLPARRATRVDPLIALRSE